MSALPPTVLQYGGLEAALTAVAEQQGHNAGFDAEVEVDAAAVGVHDELLLSVARQLLTNAARHASAGRVGIALRREGDVVVLEVADDGAGVSPERVAEARAEGRIGLALGPRAHGGGRRIARRHGRAGERHAGPRRGARGSRAGSEKISSLRKGPDGDP